MATWPRATWLLAGLFLGVTLSASARPALAEPRAQTAGPAGLSPAEWRSIVAQIQPQQDRAKPVVGHPLAADPIAQQAYLKASNTAGGDQFGWSVAVSGDTLVVGAPLEDSASPGVNGSQSDNTAPNAGAAYVFVRTGGVWTQQAYLKASNPNGGDQFGMTVAISGDTVVVGAPFEASADTGVNGNQGDNTAANAGAAYVFVRSGSVWSQQAYLKASNTNGGDQFGSSVAVSGDTVVVGAPFEDSASSNQADNSALSAGAAYVFVRSGSVWSQQAYIKASNPNASDQFGISVAVSANTLVVGALGEASATMGVNGDQGDNSAAAAGAAYVFVRSGSVWSQQAYLKASNTDGGDQFGSSVAIAGDTVVVGAPLEASAATGVNGNHGDNSAANAGAAYVFVRSGTVWSQQAYLKASNTGGGDDFGFSVAVSGDTVVIGALTEDSAATGVNGNQADNSAAQAGAAYVFVRTGGIWTQQAYLKASNTDAGDFFGFGVAVSGDTVVAGARLEASVATGVNGNQTDNSAAQAGAAYVFAGLGPGLVNVAVNQGQFTAGTTLHLAVSVNNPGQPTIANFFVGAFLPDGDTLMFITGSGNVFGRFSDPTTYRPIASAVPLSAPLVLAVPDFLVYTWTGGEPHGSYQFFLAAVDAVTGNILGLSTATAVLGP